MVELWTLDGTEEQIEDVIAIFRLSLGLAEEAEVAHPETISALRKWCNIEYKRMHPPAQVRHVSKEQEVRESLSRSPHSMFWENLKAEQEVRWTGTRSATYFVVDPEPVSQIPDSKHRAIGAYIELRRHTGKTFWTHIAKVRPLEEGNDG